MRHVTGALLSFALISAASAQVTDATPRLARYEVVPITIYTENVASEYGRVAEAYIVDKVENRVWRCEIKQFIQPEERKPESNCDRKERVGRLQIAREHVIRPTYEYAPVPPTGGGRQEVGLWIVDPEVGQVQYCDFEMKSYRCFQLGPLN